MVTASTQVPQAQHLPEQAGDSINWVIRMRLQAAQEIASGATLTPSTPESRTSYTAQHPTATPETLQIALQACLPDLQITNDNGTVTVNGPNARNHIAALGGVNSDRVLGLSEVHRSAPSGGRY